MGNFTFFKNTHLYKNVARGSGDGMKSKECIQDDRRKNIRLYR